MAALRTRLTNTNIQQIHNNHQLSSNRSFSDFRFGTYIHDTLICDSLAFDTRLCTAVAQWSGVVV